MFQLKFIEAGWTAEPLPLAVNHENIVSSSFAWQVFTAMLTAIHDQAVCHSVAIEAMIAAQLVCHVFKANFMTNLS